MYTREQYIGNNCIYITTFTGTDKPKTMPGRSNSFK